MLPCVGAAAALWGWELPHRTDTPESKNRNLRQEIRNPACLFLFLLWICAFLLLFKSQTWVLQTARTVHQCLFDRFHTVLSLELSDFCFSTGCFVFFYQWPASCSANRRDWNQTIRLGCYGITTCQSIVRTSLCSALWNLMSGCALSGFKWRCYFNKIFPIFCGGQKRYLCAWQVEERKQDTRAEEATSLIYSNRTAFHTISCLQTELSDAEVSYFDFYNYHVGARRKRVTYSSGCNVKTKRPEQLCTTLDADSSLAGVKPADPS